MLKIELSHVKVRHWSSQFACEGVEFQSCHKPLLQYWLFLKKYFKLWQYPAERNSYISYEYKKIRSIKYIFVQIDPWTQKKVLLTYRTPLYTFMRWEYFGFFRVATFWSSVYIREPHNDIMNRNQVEVLWNPVLYTTDINIQSELAIRDSAIV